MGQRATLKQVAEKAGVSLGMAGRVLGKYGSSSDATKKKVSEAARALNYTPSAIARSLRTNVTKTIGVLIPDITASFWATLVRGIQDKAAKAEYGVILCNSDEQSEDEKLNLLAMSERNVDGLIVSPTPHNHTYLRRLARSGVPVVQVDRRIENLRSPSILADNRAGAYEAVRHLIDLGHKRIAIITGIPGVATSDERLEGYREALRDGGIPQRKTLVKQGCFRNDRAYAVTEELLRLKNAPSAVFVCSERMVSGCILALRKSGLRIPGDMAIVGYDDPVWTAFLEPPLTTVSQPSYTMGLLAFEYLLDRISGNRRDQNYLEEVILKPTLVVRRSCGTEATSCELHPAQT